MPQGRMFVCLLGGMCMCVYECVCVCVCVRVDTRAGGWGSLARLRVLVNDLFSRTAGLREDPSGVLPADADPPDADPSAKASLLPESSHGTTWIQVGPARPGGEGGGMGDDGHYQDGWAEGGREEARRYRGKEGTGGETRGGGELRLEGGLRGLKMEMDCLYR